MRRKSQRFRWKLSFINLVAGGMEVKEATAYFGIGIATGYKWIRRWNSEGKEGLRRRKIPGRPPKLSEKELKELKRILKAKPYWSVKDEASPQNQANTVRVLSFGKPRTFKKYGQDES
jgi:transposase